jgi:hypothetical protein
MLTDAQDKNAIISGKIAYNATPIDAATVFLLKSSDSSVIKIAISDNKGLFKFTGILPGSFLLKISKVGYVRALYGPFETAPGQVTDLSQIKLQQVTNELKEVIINAQQQYIELRGDKTVLNVDQNLAAPGNSVFDILKTAPGVRVVDDQILYKAGQKALIAINGRAVNLTDEQLAGLLRSYPGEMISQIELIQNPSGKYDAASAGGVINLVIKRSKDLGSTVSVTQSGSYGDRDQTSTAVNVSLRTKKINVFASYNFVDGKSIRTFTNNRSILTDSAYNFDLNYKSITHYINNNFTVGADYLVAKNQTIGLLVSGYINNSNIDKYSTTDIYTSAKPDSSINTNSHIVRDLSTINYNLNYKGSYGKAGKTSVSANLDYSDYNRHSSENLTDITYDKYGRQQGDTLKYHDQSPSHIQIWSGKVDFSQMFTKNTSIEAGTKISQVNSSNNLDFDQAIDGVYQPVAALTDNFIYKERIAAGYVVYNLRFSGTQLQASLRGEQTKTDAISVNPETQTHLNYFDLFPKLLLTRIINKNNELSLSFARSITRPNYQDLNPFIGYVNQFYFTTGNPFLKPEYINDVSLSDLYLRKFRVTLSTVITNGFSNSIFIQNDSTKAYTVTKSNIATRYQYIAHVELPFEIMSWWNVNFDLKGSYEIYDYVTGNVLQKRATDAALQADQTFKVTKKLTAQLNGFYEAPTYYAISQYKSYYYLNGGLRYAILSNNGSIGFFARDIFNTDKNRYHTNFENLDLTATEKNLRYVTATFTYRFGKRTVKTVAKHNTGIDEETNRLKSDQ